jgi:hypothetical protein
VARVIVVGLAMALILAACGESAGSRRNTVVFLDASAKTSRRVERDFISCLRKEGIKVLVPRVATAFPIPPA